ncbi:MAG: hypothetical protein M9962_01615 [Oligoflexia bacterium]|nr:hypothetical protein [Oligoflexia bacterium]
MTTTRAYLFYLILIMVVGWKLGTSTKNMVNEMQVKRQNTIAHALQNLD